MGRNRIIAPAIPFVMLHGSTSFNVTTTPTPLTWIHAHFITKDFNFKNGNARINVTRGIDTAGIYMIYVSCGAVKATGNPTELILSVYQNGSICECASAYGSVGAGTEHADAILVTAIYLDVGDYLEIYISTDNGTVTTEESTARWMISALPMGGWNNNRGGNIRSRGDVVY